MTAVVSTYTSDGFVIGADGLRKELNGFITSRKAQKIFPIQRDGMPAAFAWAGQTRLEYADRSDFDFIEETSPAIARIKVGISAEQFARELASDLMTRVNDHNGNTPIPMVGRKANEVVRCLLVGYWNNNPFRTELSFLQENGIIVLNADTTPLKVQDFRVFSGSAIVLDETDVDCCMSLNSCIDTVREYIQKCADNKIDHYCRSIGGHIHIATITPESFKWIIPPII
jgi:hypothetical protein